jgi:hypothetical protein
LAPIKATTAPMKKLVRETMGMASRPARSARVGDGPAGGHQEVAVEDQEVDQGDADIDDAMADALHQRVPGAMGAGRSGFGLARGVHQMQQAPHPGARDDPVVMAAVMHGAQHAQGA